jgi:predicted ABC-type ATPase
MTTRDAREQRVNKTCRNYDETKARYRRRKNEINDIQTLSNHTQLYDANGCKFVEQLPQQEVGYLIIMRQSHCVC